MLRLYWCKVHLPSYHLALSVEDAFRFNMEGSKNGCHKDLQQAERWLEFKQKKTSSYSDDTQQANNDKPIM